MAGVHCWQLIVEATTVADLPRHVGTLRGRRLRKLLRRLVASPDGPLLGFPGPSAPYWEFRGFRPSVAIIKLTSLGLRLPWIRCANASSRLQSCC